MTKTTYNSPTLRSSVPLTSVTQIPKYRRVDFIHTGYRGHNYEGTNAEDIPKHHNPSHEDLYHYPFEYCLRSLFTLHNETINIWTHLIAGIFFMILGYHGLDHLFISKNIEIPPSTISTMFPDTYFDSTNLHFHGDKLVYLAYIFGCACCFLGSAIFHLFNPISKSHHFHLRIIDFAGISFMCLGSQWPLMYYAFYCEPVATSIYSFVLVLLSIFGFTFPFFPIFHTDKYRKARITLYVGMAAVPMIMFLHIVGQYGLYHESSYLWGFLGVVYLIYLLGLIFYAWRIPERYWPGKFDIFFASHQIWHCLGCLAAYVWYHGFTTYMKWRMHAPCAL